MKMSFKFALSLATLTFSKTRFCSHINFIGRCLKNVVLVNSIRLKIHDLNSKLFQYLQDHKNQKLFELTGRDPNSNSKPLEQRYNVVTIPEDLPLSEPEKSILGKGLNFVPLTKKTDEFTVKEDTEKFLRRVKLKILIDLKKMKDKQSPNCVLYVILFPCCDRVQCRIGYSSPKSTPYATCCKQIP